MIAMLSGNIANVTLNGDVILDVNGVGYKVQMPERETTNLRVGNPLNVFVHTQVREDSIILFGFAQASSQELFEKITSVSGIGGKLALVMLSALGAQGIVDALSNSDVDMLCSVPGIGKKTAQRLIVELSNLKAIFDIFVPNQQSTSQQEAREALEELGYRRDEISNVLSSIDSTLSIDVMIKECLRSLAKNQ
jgi:Holliday junction DNA helicase RuvA